MWRICRFFPSRSTMRSQLVSMSSRTGVDRGGKIGRPLHQLDLGRRGRLALDQHALPQAVQAALLGHAFHLRQVGLRHVEIRVRQLVRQLAVVREQQQALAVLVQPPGRLQPE